MASGLINTSRQIGGAVGVAAISAIAAASANGYVASHGAGAVTSGAALDHGFQTGLYVLVGLLLAGALIVVALVRPSPVLQARPVDEAVALEEAA